MTTKDFLLSLPEKINPAALEGLATCFHFDISGDDAAQMTINVADGKCEVTEGFSGEPKCVVKASNDDFLNIVTGKMNPMMAVFTGKLKMSNQGEMLKYAKIFGLM
ncbi:MAG: hypothetical protein RL757_730 [Bacteroidota bacterium]|jgi:putative sterol carrier protein